MRRRLPGRRRRPLPPLVSAAGAGVLSPGRGLPAARDQPADAPLGEGLELGERERRLEAAEHALEETAVDRADELPMVVDEVTERAGPQRDLDRGWAPAVEPRVESRSGHRLLEDREVPPGRQPRPRLGAPLDDQVLAPLPRELLRPVARALARKQAGEDLGEQAVVAALRFLADDHRVERLGAPDRGALADLALDEADLLEPAEVRPKRVRVQGQAGR